MAIAFTDAALRRVRHLTAERPGSWLRLAIRGGGCSGMSYHVDVVDAPGDKDKRLPQSIDGAAIQVCVDPKSYLFLVGMEVDFQDDLVRQGFVFDNPNAKRSCSCGESFTV
jgi:iron-sulfur cluster assembly protein